MSTVSGGLPVKAGALARWETLAVLPRQTASPRLLPVVIDVRIVSANHRWLFGTSVPRCQHSFIQMLLFPFIFPSVFQDGRDVMCKEAAQELNASSCHFQNSIHGCYLFAGVHFWNAR